MTAYINKLKDKTGNQQLPVTHERAVRDDNGTTLETKLQNLKGAMDKAYVANSDNGMGRITLHKNMVSGVNTLTQSMMQATNTIYVIRYDFTLGENITVPANCILEFDGGSISGNYKILNLENTKISGYAKFDTKVSITGDYGEKVCPIVFSGFVKENDGIDYEQVRFASVENLPLNLCYAHNTPSRYGAKCDETTDSTAAIQCCINVMGWQNGEVDLRKINNDGNSWFKTTAPVIVYSGQDWDGTYKYAQRVTRIIGDHYEENRNELNKGHLPTIKAYNIPKLKGALEIVGRTNSQDESCSMEYVNIDSTDSSNDDLSFALVVRDSKLCYFNKCKFIGINAVLDLSGYSQSEGGLGYSKICMTWQNCKFASTSTNMGYALCHGAYFDIGQQNGDNTIYISCEFAGRCEIACGEISFKNCQFALAANKNRDTLLNLGLVDSSSPYKNVVVDFSTAIAVLDVSNSFEMENCYFEDYRIGIDFCEYYGTDDSFHNLYVTANIKNTFMSGYVNPAYGSTNAEYGIVVRNKRGMCNITLSGMNFDDHRNNGKGFVYAPIANYNKYPIYLNNTSIQQNNQLDIETKCIGNIIINYGDTQMLPTVMAVNNGGIIYDVKQLYKRGFKNLVLLIGPFTSEENPPEGIIEFYRPVFSDRDANGYPQFSITGNETDSFDIGSSIVGSVTDGTNVIYIIDVLRTMQLHSQDVGRILSVWTEYNTNLKVGYYTTTSHSTLGKKIKAMLTQSVFPGISYDDAVELLG